MLRPAFIWGRDHGYVAALGLRVSRLDLVICSLSRCSLTHVEHCADLFAVSATDSRAVGQTFNVVAAVGERVWPYLGAHLLGGGEGGIRIPIPYRLAIVLVRMAYATVFARNPKLPNILIPCRFESRLKPFRYTNRRAREVLGWEPPLDFRECLARTYGVARPLRSGSLAREEYGDGASLHELAVRPQGD